MASKRKQTSAARSTLAARRATNQAEGAPLTQTGKRRRLNLDSPNVPPASTSVQLRPRPRPHQVSQLPTDNSIAPSMAPELPMMPANFHSQTTETSDTATKSPKEDLLDKPACSLEGTASPDDKSTTEKEAVEVAQPVDNLPPTKPVVSGDVDQYDSDVMVLDRPEGRDADGVNNGLWGSDAEITAQMVASEATPARIPSKNGPVRGTSGKSMPNVVSAKRAPKVPVKKAQVHPSESDGDDYDDESDGILSELEDSNDEMVQLKPIAEGVELLQIEVPRFQGVKVLKIQSDLDYDSFCEKIARVLDCSPDDMKLGYVAGKKKDLKGKPTPHVVENRVDYDDMVVDAVRAIEAERTRYRKEKEKILKAVRKAKGKAGPPIKRKASPFQEYIIRLVVMETDLKIEKGKKGRKKKGISGSGGGMGRCTSDSDEYDNLTPKQMSWFDRLSAKHACATHKHKCAVLPGIGNEPGGHVRLQKHDLLFWAERLAMGDPDVSILVAPKALNLYDRLHKEAKEQKKAESANSEITAPNANPLQAPAMPGTVNWFYGPQAASVPYLAAHAVPAGYPGPPPGYSQFPIDPALPPSLSRRQPPADPLLAQWLEQCDSGPRGADGHQFLTFLPALNANWLTRLSDIARLTSPKDLIDCTLEHPPKMPFGTASRLLDYAKSDYQ